MKTTGDFGATGKKSILFVLRISLTLMLLWSAPTWAKTVTEQMQGLIAQGKLQQALHLSNQALNKDGSSLTRRFLKGLILTKLNRLDEARELFIALTKTHPDLPEPYNNLATVAGTKTPTFARATFHQHRTG